MAEKYPLANGNWSDAANWNGGTKPLAGDDVHANGKSVTIDEDVTVNTIRGTAGTTAVSGGQFATSGAVTVTVANGVWGGNSSSGTLIVSSGGVMYGDAYEGLVNGRISVSVSGGVMYGDAKGDDSVKVNNGGVMYGDAQLDTTAGQSRVGYCVNVDAGGVMYGDVYSSGSQQYGGNISAGGVLVGNTYGGTTSLSYGCSVSGHHIGNSYGGTGSSSYGTRAISGGVHIGTAYGGNGAMGTLVMYMGLFFGDAVGGSSSGGHGVSISSGFAQIGTATGTVDGAFGVFATDYSTVLIAAESGDYAADLAGTVITDSSRYPFASSAGAVLPAFQHGLAIGRAGA